MKKLQFIKPSSDDNEETAIDPIELLLDPMRTKILFEVILNNEITAEKLMESTKKSRSTISHHLKKLVESGIIEVYMNPTGKIKHYQLNKKFTNRFYTLDKEGLTSSSLEESSEFVIEFLKMIAMVGHIYANMFSEQVKLLQEKIPFEKVIIDENNDITFFIGGKKHKMPYTTNFITGKKEAEFLTKGLKKLMKEFMEEFGDSSEAFLNLDSKPMYLFNAQLFPYFDEKDFKD
ncbi:MAG TPA: winged helix-turn-helix domain-containing protein [candidate division Zixibacteria bacterium]|nr:winged helix-turn-helix domain-containing protein [candidate division Zixibacteria bacterium]